MSASREKKNRQELAASGIPDIKDIRAAEDRKQQRRNNWLYGSIAIIFVLVAAALLLWNSNIIQRGATAMTVDGQKYSAAEVSYFYRSSYNSLTNSQYASYMGLDPSKPLDQQTMNDTAKMLLGITSEEEMTYQQYLMDSTKKSLVELTVMLRKAEEEGFTFTDEMQADVDATLKSLEEGAKSNGMSKGAYLKALFGPNMTSGTFEKLLKDTVLATHYMQNYQSGLNYTDDQLEEHYQAHKGDFDVAAYDYIYFKGTAPATTDADGKSIPPTEEENKAAAEKAQAAAEEALTRYQNGESLEDIANSYEIGSYFSQTDAANYGDTMSTWLFDDARKSGDVEILESNGNRYLMLFHSRGRNDYDTVNVRHILCKVDTTGLDKEAEDYETKLAALKDEQKAKADKIMQEWKDAGATEEAFAKLAEQYSDDGGSNTNGGLYTQISKGRMVPEFNDWIFEANRQAGDSDILFVESSNYSGYHVMYFSGYDAPFWKLQVKGAMSQEDFTKWHDELIKDVTATENSGMKYVG